MSCLQLIHECKEVLLGAVKVKQYYQFMVLSVISSDCQDQTKLDLELFEEDMKSMLEVCAVSMQSFRTRFTYVC